MNDDYEDDYDYTESDLDRWDHEFESRELDLRCGEVAA